LTAYNKNKRTSIDLSSVKNKKGVYKTFAEFKSNQPSIAEFEFSKGAMGDILYVKENNSEYPFRNAWGYCDGNKIFINSCDKYFQLHKRQNTLYFTGLKGIKKVIKTDVLGSSILAMVSETSRKKTKFVKVMKYYVVDMETGDVF
jgi:hypothetical protein